MIASEKRMQESEKQMLDLLFTVGSYAMLAMVINGARIQNEV